jgi:hypothetical protein
MSQAQDTFRATPPGTIFYLAGETHSRQAIAGIAGKKLRELRDGVDVRRTATAAADNCGVVEEGSSRLLPRFSRARWNSSPGFQVGNRSALERRGSRQG